MACLMETYVQCFGISFSKDNETKLLGNKATYQNYWGMPIISMVLYNSILYYKSVDTYNFNTPFFNSRSTGSDRGI